MRLVRSSKHLGLTYGVALGGLVLSFLGALAFGAVPISLDSFFLLEDPVRVATGREYSAEGASARIIVTQLRLPRALLAMVIGMTLAVCGCLSQGLFRNPLADPSLIGVSAGASLGAGIAIVFLIKCFERGIKLAKGEVRLQAIGQTVDFLLLDLSEIERLTGRQPGPL